MRVLTENAVFVLSGFFVTAFGIVAFVSIPDPSFQVLVVSLVSLYDLMVVVVIVIVIHKEKALSREAR